MQSARSCLRELEALSNQTDPDTRRRALRRVTDLFFLTGDRQDSQANAIFGSVMERIAYELEVEARAELAFRIAESSRAPHTLITRLAGDDIAVARPVLERSPVLTEQDLLKIASTRSQSHLHAISRRPSLAAPVTDVLVAHGDGDVLASVTRNAGARFSSAGLGSLAEKALHDADLLDALGGRHDLPPELRRRIKQRVAERIKAEMADAYDESDIADLDALVDRTEAGLDIGRMKRSNDEITRRARTDNLTEDDVLQFAKAGRLNDTVHALSVLSGLDGRIVSHCLLKADMSALGIICKANGFRPTTYLSLLQIRIGREGVAARDVARAMREYDTLGRDSAVRALRFVNVRQCIEAAG